MARSRRVRRSLTLTLVVAGALAGFGAGRLTAQQDGIQRTVLLKTADPASARHDVIMATAELSAGSRAGKHRHPGLEIGYVLNGSVSLEVQGTQPQTLKPGDTYKIDVAQPHDVTTLGSSAAKVLAIYVVEMGKPLAENVQ